MLKFLKLAALSAVIGAGVLGAVPASAQSGGVYLGLGGGHRGPDVGVWVGGDDDDDGYRRHRDRDDYRDYRRHRDWDERRYERGEYRGCQPWQAVNKAERMGVRRARVEDVGRSSIRVSGRARGDFVMLRFARAPGCPLIRR